MRALKKYPVITSLLLLTVCVTINVYFPAAAAESAADKIIEEVYGEDNVLDENVNSPADDGQSNSITVESNFLISFLQSIIPAAQAQQPDINISSPGINKLKSLMKKHHQKLDKYYDTEKMSDSIEDTRHILRKHIGNLNERKSKLTNIENLSEMLTENGNKFKKNSRTLRIQQCSKYAFHIIFIGLLVILIITLIVILAKS